ncbi:MAG: PASTA domain-containing protein [Muribaculaceae bacterium]|nr:PASTA domain-containing protein [Muribaculaceae bacterium]
MEHIKKIIAFFKKHPLLRNLIYICLAGWLILIASMFFLDYWTRHGETAVVPMVKGLNLSAAEQALRAKGMVYELSDSIYDRSYAPGTVVEQSPRANAKVKPGRTVYLTIVAFSPKLVTVPPFQNVSMREGKAMFEGLGFKQVRVVEVESEYKGLVLGAKVSGVPLKPGQRVPVSSVITLEVGKGMEVELPDSVEEDDKNITDYLKDYFNAD